MAGPGHTDTQEAGQTHAQRRRRARAQLTAGQRSDECPGGGEQALHPTARAGGRRPRGGWPGRPLVATPAARPRPPPQLLACLSVGLRGSAPPRRPAPLPAGRPTFSAGPRRALGAAWLSASSGPGPWLRARGSGGPWRSPPALVPPAPAAGAFPAPPPAALSLSLGTVLRPARRARPRDPAAGRPRRRRPLPRWPPGALSLSCPCRPTCPGRLPGSRRVSPRGLRLRLGRPPGLPLASRSLCPLSPLRVAIGLSPRPCPPPLAPSRSRRGPRCLGPRPPPLPRPRLAREPELPPPAARRELPTPRTPPRFARLSPLLARDPRRPAAEAAPPQRRSPGHPAGRGPAPSPPRGWTANPLPPARRAGQAQGPGAAGGSCRRSCPGFSADSGSAPPRTRSEKPLPGFLAPQRQVEGVPRAGKGVGARGSVPRPVALGHSPHRRPFPPQVPALLCTPLRRRRGPCWGDPHNQSPGQHRPFLQMGRLSTRGSRACSRSPRGGRAGPNPIISSFL